VEKEHLQRIRITLRGHFIWRTVNDRRIYLDGQAFGIPGTETSGHKPLPTETAGNHIDLLFPSGTGRPASDFESWFYIREEEGEEEVEEDGQEEKPDEDGSDNDNNGEIANTRRHSGFTSFFSRIFRGDQRSEEV
jgi:hypothetical protein